jgi:NADH:ubiquinone oxidoreductase subunit E
MGGVYLQSLSDHLDAELQSIVEIDGARCLGLCKDSNAGNAPFVLVNDEVMSEVTLSSLIERIESIATEKGI